MAAKTEPTTLSALDRLKDEIGSAADPDELNRLVQALGEIIEPTALPQWFRSPHPDLAGRTPLDAVRQGEANLLWDMVYSVENGVAS